MYNGWRYGVGLPCSIFQPTTAFDDNPYDAVEMQNELEDHSYTKDLWWYGFDRTSIPYRKNTIDEYLYDFLTTDVDKIKEKYR